MLAGDPLGLWAVSAEAVRQRDELVFRAALEHGVPVVMLLSGGYTPASTPCIAASIESLMRGVLGAAPPRGGAGEQAL